MLASELQEYFDYYFTAKTDQLRFAVRRIAMRAIGLAMFLIAAAVTGATAIELLLLGIVGALSELFGHPWPAQFLVGGIVLIVLTGGVCLRIAFRNDLQRRRTLAKYERRHRQ